MTGNESGIYYVCVYSTLSTSLSNHKSSNQIQCLSRVGQHSQRKKENIQTKLAQRKYLFDLWFLAL